MIDHVTPQSLICTIFISLCPSLVSTISPWLYSSCRNNVTDGRRTEIKPGIICVILLLVLNFSTNQSVLSPHISLCLIYVYVSTHHMLNSRCFFITHFASPPNSLANCLSSYIVFSRCDSFPWHGCH